MWKAILCIGIAFSALPHEALAQSRIADGAVTIERALTISTVRALSFGRVPANGPQFRARDRRMPSSR